MKDFSDTDICVSKTIFHKLSLHQESLATENDRFIIVSLSVSFVIYEAYQDAYENPPGAP